MSRGREFALAMTAIVIAALLVAPRGDQLVTDGPPSIYETGPSGAQAVRDLADHYDVAVRPFRQRMTGLLRTVGESTDAALLVIEPGRLSPAELGYLHQAAGTAALIIAGAGADPLMKCFGYQRLSYDDTTTVRQESDTFRALRVRFRLDDSVDSVVVDSSRSSDAGHFTCSVPPGLVADTVLSDLDGNPVAVRVAGDGIGSTVLLVADAELFRNRTLRETVAAEFVITEVILPHRGLIVDEYHHGHDDRGSMLKPLLAWSRHSPWGWLIWQVAAVALLALGFSAIRFGPLERMTLARRRAPAEHLDALATALAASGGHDEAIGAIVRGLRRRLAPDGRSGGSDWREWLSDRESRAEHPRHKELLRELVSLSSGGQSADGVRRSAIIVEELWTALHH